LTCTMEFGSWGLSGKYLRMEKHKGVGFSIGNSLTSGESYEEYSFAEEDPISCEKYVYLGPNYAPEENWPVLLYNVTVTRSWQPYARGYIATQVVLNLVGFSAFWLPPSCGERMSLSITAMLAALAAEIVVSANLPMAAEITWFSKFSILSMTFAFVSLMESVMVLYFYYKRSEDLVPAWYTFTKDWYLVRQARKRGEEVTDFVTETTNTAVDALHNTTDSLTSYVKDAGKIRETVLGTSSAEDLNGSSWHDDSLNDDGTDMLGETQRISNNVKDSAKGKFSEHLRGESGNLPRRSIMLKDFKARYGNSILSGVPAIPRDANDFTNEEEQLNNMKWKHVASRIDDVARFWVPLAYVISLSIILAEVF